MPLRHGLSKLSLSPSAMWLDRVLYSRSKVLRSAFKVATALMDKVGYGWNSESWVFDLLALLTTRKFNIVPEDVSSWETSGQWGLQGNCAANHPQENESWHSSKGWTPRVCKRPLWTCWPDKHFQQSEAKIDIKEHMFHGLVNRLSKHHPKTTFGLLVGKNKHS